ncbi:MAG: hypothetical protein A3C08_00705 [Candidatus Taylorbacteria bacterium RIFCSPHIGHO2_02_FULL_47_18]|uniref:Uncharacterized protein n=1 Tax=Candidatus Taylorbacteria bacterium RIFCSPLOWO2_01_FULL_48_100 TaxID=1802322 RepID=A0A1G2NEP5_9BACT|nr:MAG: hypothetical protein A2670_00575 [Candidatus Taylorbacteria bacterium RIFCSPHIGHO2_01_FULL_48_38]OHA27492.1 MAG: hypothetical protein A3C08_00705 [Candidatus Taylorbacteria bacterium RIFCSPHIGHO2_02_FULL_47_18]OHA34555.1 MAG: hypothetical protein A2938_03325 [Candidatus Taylorbacteria bacterium RIFCSPLOWO2_01_FULL_48_100]OHA40319.1 MAG: hypothetical protein A3J31_01800 [Candidatus Taylorbacteria bacterium RIFCSPLOWO2_02_FULL_48_16]OHA44978.1 MAG: hypothetical protein A3H13_03635 [Candid
MAMNKVVVGQSVTAGQMKDFWRQVDDGSIGGDYFQDFLAHKLERKDGNTVSEVTTPKIVIPNLLSTPPTLADWLKAREELHKFLTGEQVILRDIFALTDEELASTTLMPAFRPAGATNRNAIYWKIKIGENKPYEEIDVMKYTNSQGPKQPELYIINRSVTPDDDTVGDKAKSPNQLIAHNKLWLGLFCWCDADTLHHVITGETLDQKTWTWFPNDRLRYAKVALGYWNPLNRRVYLYWRYAVYCNPNNGARSAKKVPIKS